MRRKLVSAVTAFAMLAIVGCGSSGPKEPGTVIENELDGAPDWVLKGKGSDGEIIYGVGAVAGTRNVALARSTAQGRGRTEIARSLELGVESMLKDYQATTTGGEFFAQAANDEQHVEDVSRQITDLTLTGTRQDDHWISDTGTLYVLMALDVDDFKEAVHGMSQLNEDLRKAVEERADDAFRELDEHTR
ncbi:MAG: hypothetical protein HKP01_08905 [Gemmatimonadetes bacterium]|nr:hypothetical protein [Gemmatimonadota bacterium]